MLLITEMSLGDNLALSYFLKSSLIKAKKEILRILPPLKKTVFECEKRDFFGLSYKNII
jgi:hypothetical protein